MPAVSETSSNSSYYLTVGLLFIIAQTVLMVTFFLYSSTLSLCNFVYNICLSIITTLLSYPLTIVFWLVLFLLVNVRFRCLHWIQYIFSDLQLWKSKCKICNKMDCEINFRTCRHCYHARCLPLERKNICPICITQQLQSPDESVSGVINYVYEEYMKEIILIFVVIGIYNLWIFYFQSDSHEGTQTAEL